MENQKMKIDLAKEYHRIMQYLFEEPEKTKVRSKN